MALRKPQAPAKSGSSKQNVRVVCRVRPTNNIELSKGGVNCVKHSDTTIEVMSEDTPNVFNFDSIFGADSTQIQVFQDTAAPLIADVLSGYNATIFAYGQTGTGKTHTMEGNIHSDKDKGIIPRTVEALFEGVSEADENIEFAFKVSYVEIYLEKIRDLLDENKVKVNLTVREDKIKGVYIAGVTEEYVTSTEELLGIMATGATNRATAATGMNEGSSRSHSVFTITVTQKDVVTNATKSGKLVLVDLAGSEMVRKTNASGQQLEEAKTINKSLSALGQVINALTDKNATHIPYRDSKLTRVLQDSLGGNSKTVLIVAISPSSFNAVESVSTLRFGTRAKSIENKVTINQTRSVEELEQLLVRAEKAIDAQTSHIIALSTQLQALQAQYGDREDDESEEEGEEGGGGGGGGEKTVRMDIAKVEHEAQVMMKLQESVLQLTQELDEERQESSRKDNEIRQMSLLLKEKERLIHEAATMLQEVQRSNDTVRERCEQLLREKIDAVGELESLRALMDEEVAKSKFNFMEMEVTLSTLETENKQLKMEIAEMSGDAPSSVGGGNVKAKNVISASMQEDDTYATEKSMIRKMHNGANARPGQQATDDPARVLSSAERKEVADQFSAQFASTCLKFNIDEQASAELFAIMDGFSVEQEAFFVALEDKYYANEKVQARRIKDLDDQRIKLEKDLQGRIEYGINLQIKLESLSRMDPRQLQDAMAEKDRAYRKSLQQRLEQLVAVHRQLLRKFASLELETTELKKKTQLRDERIRQLEGNSKGLIGNIRQQAERHVAELTNLREQIQILKADHDQRVENLKLQDTGFSPRGPHNARVQQPKVLRGGGGASRSFYNMDGGSHAVGLQSDSLDTLDSLTMKGPSNANSNTPPAAAPKAGTSAGNGAPPPPYTAPAAPAATATPVTQPKTSVLSRFLGQK